MLLHLTIQNYLLVKHIDLDFSAGLTVLTGETGAGKSMILGALEVLLGEKIPKDAVRTGAERAIIECLFSADALAAVRSVIGEEEWDSGAHDLLLRREIPRQGRTRSYLNDHPIPQDTLLQLRDILADFHGQREHQSLFKPQRQLEYLDAYAESGQLLEQTSRLYAICFARKSELIRKQATLADHRKEQALLAYQLEEIERLGLKPGEEEAIKSRLTKLESAEKLKGEAYKLLNLLSESDFSMTVLAGQARSAAQNIDKTDSDIHPLVSELSDIEARIKDIGNQIRDYSESLSFDEIELENLRERRGILWELKRKHGMEIEEILARAGEMKSLLLLGEKLEEECQTLQKELHESERELVKVAMQLSKLRHRAASEFAREITAALKPLGFNAPQFEIYIETLSEPFDPAQIIKEGADHIEFRFSANPGSKLASIERVASGGESSRVTLAIKSVLATKINYPTMIYDEIDLGISGKVADQAGDALIKLAEGHQVLVITHLPQIAAKSDYHLTVEKSISGHLTQTTARYLKEKEQVAAIGALIAGSEVTDKALQSADELISQRQKQKRTLNKLG